MSYEAIHPCRLSGGRPANSQSLAYAFYGGGGFVIKLIVRFLFGFAGPEIDVGFVPDLEIPPRDFVYSVSIHDVFGELVDKFSPSIPVFWRSCVWPVPKRMELVCLGELVRHEAQLNKRPDIVREQTIIDLIHVGEVVDRVSFWILLVRSHFVMKYGVESNVAEA